MMARTSMSSNTQHSKERAATGAAQAKAADPGASAWVSANAGTGKTHVLTTRVLRLLVAGTPPERILCLTYTKAAAAEMSERVFSRLAAWVTAADDTVRDELTKLKKDAAWAWPKEATDRHDKLLADIDAAPSR